MGRIKTTLIKRTTLKLYHDYKDQFKKDYAENKVVLAKLVNIPSKKIKNIIAGYITRLVKEKSE